MTTDPRETLATSPMSVLQIAAVAITVCLNGLDGFDVLSISFAAPGIVHDWGIDRKALGIVLSMELVGMGLGAILLGGTADRLGRRRTLLSCLGLMSFGMFMASRAGGVLDLCLWRVFTGAGIGGMLAATNAVAAEFSNARRRSLNVSLMVTGYPVGAVVGGSVAALLLRHGSWRDVFEFGASATIAFVPLVLWCVPESTPWLCQRQPRGALVRINRNLERMGHAPVSALPVAPHGAQRGAVADIFGSRLLPVTVLMASAYFLHIATFYFILKWVPNIVVGMGFTQSAAAGVLVWANVGGAAGGAAFGLLSQRFGLKPLTIGVLVMSTALVIVFGHGQSGLAGLSAMCAITGFFTNGGVVGIYGILALAYPPYLRATGTGFTIGVGRFGAMLAPVLAGYLFQSGLGLQVVAIVMSSGSAIGAVALMFLPVHPPDSAIQPGTGNRILT